MFDIVNGKAQPAVIKVIGVGGGGSNAVDYMRRAALDGVEFICANTDVQALQSCGVATQLQLGSSITQGLGAGSNPEIGCKAALEDREAVLSVLEGTDMVFLTAGMGGGTGTGAAPIIAQAARERGVLTVAVVTRPFAHEGNRRARYAEDGIQKLAEHVDSLIIIPNEKLLSVLDASVTLTDAFGAANDVLLNAVQGIAELITNPGTINVDFADVRTVMAEMGMAMMGSGTASGENRATKAAETAISSPLLEDVNLSGAKGLLLNITADESLGLREFAEVGILIKRYASENAMIVIGTAIDPDMGGELRVTMVATGLDRPGHNRAPAPPSTSPTSVQPQPPVKAAGPEQDVPPDYRALDRPAVLRRVAKAPPEQPSTDLLDLPTFLRRQAD